jgi:hypothetical protein
LRFYGSNLATAPNGYDSDGNIAYGDIFVDQWGRLCFGGTAYATHFSSTLGIDQDLVCGNNSQLIVGEAGWRNLHGYGYLCAGQTVSGNGGKNALRVLDSGDLGTDMGDNNYSDPHFIIHSHTNPTTSYLSLSHNGADACVDVGTGDLVVGGSSAIKATTLKLGSTSLSEAQLQALLALLE